MGEDDDGIYRKLEGTVAGGGGGEGVEVRVKESDI